MLPRKFLELSLLLGEIRLERLNARRSFKKLLTLLLTFILTFLEKRTSEKFPGHRNCISHQKQFSGFFHFLLPSADGIEMNVSFFLQREESSQKFKKSALSELLLWREVSLRLRSLPSRARSAVRLSRKWSEEGSKLLSAETSTKFQIVCESYLMKLLLESDLVTHQNTQLLIFHTVILNKRGKKRVRRERERERKQVARYLSGLFVCISVIRTCSTCFTRAMSCEFWFCKSETAVRNFCTASESFALGGLATTTVGAGIGAEAVDRGDRYVTGGSGGGDEAVVEGVDGACGVGVEEGVAAAEVLPEPSKQHRIRIGCRGAGRGLTRSEACGG